MNEDLTGDSSTPDPQVLRYLDSIIKIPIYRNYLINLLGHSITDSNTSVNTLVETDESIDAPKRKKPRANPDKSTKIKNFHEEKIFSAELRTVFIQYQFKEKIRGIPVVIKTNNAAIIVTFETPINGLMEIHIQDSIGGKYYLLPKQQSPQEIDTKTFTINGKVFQTSTRTQGSLIWPSISPYGENKEPISCKIVFTIIPGGSSTSIVFESGPLYILTHPSMISKFKDAVERSPSKYESSQVTNFVNTTDLINTSNSLTTQPIVPLEGFEGNFLELLSFPPTLSSSDIEEFF